MTTNPYVKRKKVKSSIPSLEKSDDFLIASYQEAANLIAFFKSNLTNENVSNLPRLSGYCFSDVHIAI